MKSPLKPICLFVAAVLAGTVSALALPITPTTGTLGVNRWEGNNNSQAQINIDILPYIGSSVEVYKQDVGGGESGSLAGSYATVFLNSPGDPADANITYTGGTVIGSPAFLLVKDGNQTPAWYLYNLTSLGWNGTDTLNLTGFWPQQGAISHVTLYGGNGTTVPDGGATVGLLGVALLGLALIRRSFASV